MFPAGAALLIYHTDAGSAERASSSRRVLEGFLTQRGSSDKGLVVGVEFNLLSEEGLIPHWYKRAARRRRSRRSRKTDPGLDLLPKNGAEWNKRERKE